MKKIILTLIGFGILLTACDSQLDINRDPDDLTPAQLALNVELPGSITAVAGVQGSYWALIGGIWSQYWSQSPGSSQYRIVDSYALGTTDGISTGSWTNAYDGLLDIRNVKLNAAAQENWNYYLIATVLETYFSQMLTDWYGDIPYTEANNPLILQPSFNDAQDVYDLLISDLDDALGRNLSASKGSAPGADDLVFGGDMSGWIKFANTLKLKIYLRQTEARPAVAQAGITGLINSGVPFLDLDASLTGFTDAPNISNPLYESDKRQLNTALNLRASTTMHSYLADNSDPRLGEFYTTGNPVDQGDYNNPAGPNTFAVSILDPTTPVYFISHEQSLFMQAEARERYSLGSGKALYDAAVIENFNKWGLNGSPFVAGAYTYPTAGTFAEKLSAIITQKWVSGYPGNGAESFFEWHRTGIPAVSTVTQSAPAGSGTRNPAYIPGRFAVSLNGVLGTGFPQRLLYPNTETARNKNAPSVVPITTPIWWNQ